MVDKNPSEKTDEKTSNLLFDIAYKELEYERNRATNLETKALAYITIGGILFSILTTYFLFDPSSEFIEWFTTSFKVFKVVFLICYISFIISWIPLIICMKPYTSITFDIAKLIDEYKSNKFEKALKDLTNLELKEYVTEIAKKTKVKSTALLFGFIVIIFSGFVLVTGIILNFLNI
ncbi:hypothetical protein LCGC14_0606340 [marine sediment metagenome]|uniref:Uncharacterized protein n=1 Tax=marine sediment metagenome TaxID=412755 RepID=A0A0F9R935_9ZZZZ